MTRVVNLRHESYDIYIGRGSKYGNPFVIGRDGNREEVVRKYEEWILSQPETLVSLHDLKDKVLGCYCKPKACHGDVLASMVDELF